LHKSIVSSKINTLWQYIPNTNISISKTSKTKMASLQRIFKSRSRSNRIFSQILIIISSTVCQMFTWFQKVIQICILQQIVEGTVPVRLRWHQ